jgi:hypothetical protein
MPVNYQIDKATKLIRTRCIGQVTLEEVAHHFKLLEQDPDCPEQLDVLLDLSAQKTIPERIEIMAISQEISRVQGRVHFNSCAIVVPTSDALFGMIRMFEVFTEKQFKVIQLFRTVQEAEDWLKVQQLNSVKNADV